MTAGLFKIKNHDNLISYNYIEKKPFSNVLIYRHSVCNKMGFFISKGKLSHNYINLLLQPDFFNTLQLRCKETYSDKTTI